MTVNLLKMWCYKRTWLHCWGLDRFFQTVLFAQKRLTYVINNITDFWVNEHLFFIKTSGSVLPQRTIYSVYPNIHFKAADCLLVKNHSLYSWDPRGHKDACVHICVYVCLCILICLEHFHVSLRDLHPPNSSSRLLITKILRSLVSCRYFSLSLPVFSFAPCCSSQPLVIIGLH